MFICMRSARCQCYAEHSFMPHTPSPTTHPHTHKQTGFLKSLMCYIKKKNLNDKRHLYTYFFFKLPLTYIVPFLFNTGKCIQDVYFCRHIKTHYLLCFTVIKYTPILFSAVFLFFNLDDEIKSSIFLILHNVSL